MFNVGDKIIINPKLSLESHPSVISEMLQYKSMHGIITKQTEYEEYWRLNIDCGGCYWHESLFTHDNSHKSKREILDYINEKYKLKIQIKE